MEETSVASFDVLDDNDPNTVAGMINKKLKELRVSAADVISIMATGHSIARVFYRQTRLVRR